MVSFDNVLDGLIEYINVNMIPGFNDLQEIGARMILGEIYDSRKVLKETLINNGIIRTFNIIDDEGNIDVERLMARLKSEMQKKGSLKFSIPMYGTFTFKPDDIDEIMRYIRRGQI